MSKDQILNRLEFHISYSCLNNCLFCSEYNRLKEFRKHPLTFREIEKVLKRGKEQGFKHINFTGGEPTIYPDFSRVVQLAKELNYKVYIGTNGIMWASKKFCSKVLPYIDELCISVYGHNAKLHNLHTNNKTSFDCLKRGLRNINEHPKDIYLFINIVATVYNLDHLTKIIKFISRFKKVKQIIVSNIAPEGRALENFSKIAPRLKKLKLKIQEIVNLCNQKKIIVRFFGIPACILGEYKIYSNDFFWDPRMTVERTKLKNGKISLIKIRSFSPTRNKVYTKKCEECSYKNLCGGIFKDYYKRFGDEELEPIYDK